MRTSGECKATAHSTSYRKNCRSSKELNWNSGAAEEGSEEEAAETEEEDKEATRSTEEAAEAPHSEATKATEAEAMEAEAVQAVVTGQGRASPTTVNATSATASKEEAKGRAGTPGNIAGLSEPKFFY